MSRLVLCSSVLLLALCAASPAQEVAPPAEPRDARQQALDHVRGLAARIEDIHDDAARAFGFGQLGGLVCEHDKDFARSLFEKAVESALSYRDKTRRDSQRPANWNKAMAEVRRADERWDNLLQQVTACDTSLAVQFKEKGDAEKARASGETSKTDMYRAAELGRLNAAKEAVEYANRALEGKLIRGDMYLLFSLFYYLQRTDPAAADALFLRTIKSLYSQVRPDSELWMRAGNYLFGPMLNEKGEVQDEVTSQTIIGGVSVPELMGTRRWARPELIRAYLEASLDVLSRPTDDANQKQLAYAAAYQMRAKAREFAPALVPLFESLMQGFSSQVRETERRGSELARLQSPMNWDLARSLDEYEKTTDSRLREWRRVRIFDTLLGRGEFDRARSFAREVEDKVGRDALLTLADFREAAKLIERGDFELARQLVAKLREPLFRALLQAGIGSELARRHETQAALEAFLLAQREAQSTEARVRPRLLLGIASPLASADAAAAVAALSEAVAAFNARDGDSGEEINRFPYGAWAAKSTPVPSNPYIVADSRGFSEYVQFGPGQDYFVLRVRGVGDYDFTPALLKKFASKAEQVEVTLAGLSDEWARAGALASLAAAYLERLPPADK